MGRRARRELPASVATRVVIGAPTAYVSSMVEPRAKIGTVGKIALVGVPLLAMLVAAAGMPPRAWTALSGPSHAREPAMWP